MYTPAMTPVLGDNNFDFGIAGQFVFIGRAL
jgi:hypothetical protein